jgi:hypothetical protein
MSFPGTGCRTGRDRRQRAAYHGAGECKRARRRGALLRSVSGMRGFMMHAADGDMGAVDDAFPRREHRQLAERPAGVGFTRRDPGTRPAILAMSKIVSWTMRAGGCALWSWICVTGGRAGMCWCRPGGSHRCIGPSRASCSTSGARRSRQARRPPLHTAQSGVRDQTPPESPAWRHIGRRPAGSPAGETRDPPADVPRSVGLAARGHGVLSRDSGLRYQRVDISPNARMGVALLSPSVMMSLCKS